MLTFQKSIVQTITYNGRSFFLKRDDLIDKEFSGNKARKFYTLLNTDLSSYKKIISHGSNQSNAMYSLSVLAKMKKLPFEYYVSHIPSFLKQHPTGNYKEAIQNGMQVFEKELPKITNNTLFIPEGGADGVAKEGIKLLAQEIQEWAKTNQIKSLNIFLPSGTGTTALYLQKYSNFDIYTCSCVGNDEYLKKQFTVLEKNNHPIILPKKQKYHFGKLYIHLYQLYSSLKNETGIEFDLLYDPIGWETLLHSNLSAPILYIHQGGILGNVTMKERYARKYFHLKKKFLNLK